MKFIIAILVVLVSAPASAQYPDLSTTIVFSETGTEDVDSIQGGFSTTATLCLDESFDEVEVPLLPPAGLFPVFNLECVDEITDLKKMCQVDMRPWPAAGVDSVVQEIRIQREFGQTITLSWRGLEENIFVDSIVVSDPFGIYVGRVDLEGELEIDNEFVRDMTLTWYFNPNRVSVDDTEIDVLHVYPNPSTSSQDIRIDNSRSIEKISVYDVQGRTVAVYDNSSQLTAPTVKGLYSLKILFATGEVATSTLLVE